MSEKHNTLEELGLRLWLRWHLSTKRGKAQLILRYRDIAPNEFVTIRCNCCGEKVCFCPSRVMFAPECECGNKDVGNCREWSKGQFGAFRLEEIYTLTMPLLFGGSGWI